MAANAHSRVKRALAERLGRHAVDDVDNIQIEHVTDLGEFVDEGDVNVAHRVFHRLDGFRVADGMHLGDAAKRHLRNM